jgi:5-methylcytosine-specific restriction endonuclease McrA
MTHYKYCSRCDRPVPLDHKHPKRKLPRDRWYRDQRARILAASTHCGICGKPFTNPNDPTVLDHIVPRAYGGNHEQWNLQAAHRSCNARKSSQLPSR